MTTMRLKPIQTKPVQTHIFVYKDTYTVEIIENDIDNTYDVWLSKIGIGLKEFVIGLPIFQQSFSEVELIAVHQLENGAIDIYLEDMRAWEATAEDRRKTLRKVFECFPNPGDLNCAK